MLRTTARATAVVALGAAAIIGAAASASASASGSAGIGSFQYTTSSNTIVGVPWGCRMTHTIIGHDQVVTQQYVDVSCFGIAALRGPLFCGSSASFDYYDTAGRLIRHDGASGGAACSSDLRLVNASAPLRVEKTGTACASFVVGGTTRAKVCHAIES